MTKQGEVGAGSGGAGGGTTTSDGVVGVKI